MHTSATQPTGPAPWVKRVVSLGIAFHFFAILATVVGLGTPPFPPPVLAEMVRLSYPVNTYLHCTFLTNPYRFYAPNPGPTNIMWFRLHYADGYVKWVELARRDEWAMRIPFQRHMSLTMLLSGLTEPDPNDPRKIIIYEEGQVCIASYVRHVARFHARTSADGAVVPVNWVTVYNVYHEILQPLQIRMNVEQDDLRMYDQTYLGVYRSDGVRNPDGDSPEGFRIANPSYLLAQSLLQDVAPLIQDAPAQERFARIEHLNLPATWQKVLKMFPELLNDLQPLRLDEEPSAQRDRIEALQNRIMEKVTSRDKPEPEDPFARPAKRRAPNGKDSKTVGK
jgi:hypothetical protein